MKNLPIREELSQLTKGRHILSGGDLVDLGIVTHSTLSKWRKSGKGPPCLKLSDGKYIYPAKAFINWMMSCCIDQEDFCQKEEVTCFSPSENQEITNKDSLGNKKEEISI